MFGIVQGVGVAAPFALPSASQPGSAQFARARRSQSTVQPKRKAKTSFRDDTHPRLVALRYEQTQTGLEEPIPLPPPRSPLRQLPSSSRFRSGSHTQPGSRTRAHTHTHAHSLNSTSTSTSTSPSPSSSNSHSRSHSDCPPRPSSYIPPPSAGPGAISAVAPVAAAVPPRRPPPPTETHPALRTISSPRQPDPEPSWRDPSLAPSSSSRSHTYYDADTTDDEDDPFAYENIDDSSAVHPLQLRQRSACSSMYSLYERADDIPTQPDEAEVRVSEADSRPSETFSSPALSLSVSGTASPASPASPATPPPQFTKRFARSLSLRSGHSKKASSMKKLRKKSLQAGREAAVGGDGVGGDNGNNSHTSNFINDDHIPPPLPDSWRAGPNPIHPGPQHAQTHVQHPPSSDAISPVISTDIPCESFFEEDDLTKLSFSIRGSLIFGGRRPWKTTATSHPKMPDRDAAIPEQPERERERPDLPAASHARVFPLVPTATRNNGPRPVRPPRQDDMGVAAIIQPPTNVTLNANPQPAANLTTTTIATNPVKDAPSTPTSTTGGKLPPSIRVISAEAEKESQKGKRRTTWTPYSNVGYYVLASATR